MEKSSATLIDKCELYQAAYIRTSKAIGVLWGVFTVCFAIIDIVVFVQPQWIGDTRQSKGTGYFGLWQWCTPSPVDGVLECRGQLDDLSSLLSTASRSATILVGLSVVVTLLCVCCFLLFFFFSATTVFHIAGSLQLISATLLLVGIVVFPIGFSSPEVKEVCGHTARPYNVGECELRWAFLLALIGIVDAVVLSALAFVLATRTVKMASHGCPTYPGEISPQYVGDAASLAGSRKSLNLQPIMIMPDPDRYSEYSHQTGPRCKTPGGMAMRGPHPGGPYSSGSLHNFQL